MPVVRWTLYDPIDLVTYTFAKNPTSGGSPQGKKRINYQNTSAPGGRTLIYEGQDEVMQIPWEGTLLTEAEYNALWTWWDKRRQLRLTDDLGRQFWIYIQSFEPRRVLAATAPWKHTYSIQAVVLDWSVVA